MNYSFAHIIDIDMKTHDSLSSAKALVGLFVFAIVSVIFYKFYQNQDYFLDDPTALRNYVVFAIVGSGFLIGLLYLTAQTTSKTKSSKKKKK